MSRLLWRLRGRRLVRLHHHKMEQSLEGVLVGIWADHYILRVAKLIENAERSISFEGPEVRVLCDHVLYVEVLR